MRTIERFHAKYLRLKAGNFGDVRIPIRRVNRQVGLATINIAETSMRRKDGTKLNHTSPSRYMRNNFDFRKTRYFSTPKVRSPSAFGMTEKTQYVEDYEQKRLEKTSGKPQEDQRTEIDETLQ
jgi:hypothetical protein